MKEQLLRLPDVMTLTGCSRAWLYAAIRQGDFPPPIALGARSVAWVGSQVDGWIADRIAKAKIARKAA